MGLPCGKLVELSRGNMEAGVVVEACVGQQLDEQLTVGVVGRSRGWRVVVEDGEAARGHGSK